MRLAAEPVPSTVAFQRPTRDPRRLHGRADRLAPARLRIRSVLPVVDGQRALDAVRRLSVEIGPRVAGTDGELAARNYIQNTLEGYGYDVTLQDFAFDATAYLPARIEVSPVPGRPGGTSIPAIALRGSAAGDVVGHQLRAAGIGRPEDFPPGGLAGDVALIERGDLTFTQKVANAIAAGASAVVIYNNVPERGVFDLGDPVAIPVVSIDQSAGQDLVAQLATQAQEVQVSVTPPKGTAYNVIAKPKGVASCDTVSGGHYDSVARHRWRRRQCLGLGVRARARPRRRRAAPGRAPLLRALQRRGVRPVRQRRLRQEPLARGAQSLRGMVNLDVVGNADGLRSSATPIWSMSPASPPRS